MIKAKKQKSKGLVLSYLERVSSSVFSDFPKIVTDLASQKHGVYALYKGNHLYYVGLASNLKSRIKYHLRDRHSKKWDRFSLYLVTKARHLKELESLVLKIADPKGNRTHGKFSNAENLLKKLKSHIILTQKKQLSGIVGTKTKRTPKIIPKHGEESLRKPVLVPYIKAAFKIQAYYKGILYKARARKDGRIYFKGSLYTSPSSAGRIATGRSTNGWWFWKYKNKSGKWVRLKELRKK
jgi:hypothetical protein